MVISLTRMLQSFGQAQDDLPTAAAKQAQQQAANNVSSNKAGRSNNKSVVPAISALTMPQRTERICDALAQVNNIRSPTPLTDRYLANRAQLRPINRPPFDPDTMWTLKHGRCPIMTELIDVVDEALGNVGDVDFLFIPPADIDQ